MIDRLGLLVKGLPMRMYVVGGWVRDTMLGLDPKDMDLVVVSDMSDSKLVDCLNTIGHVKIAKTGGHTVGKNFSVFQWKPEGFEEYMQVARARKEVANGATRDTVVITQGVQIEEDLYRRDVTINAMAIEVTTGDLIDPFHGRDDIKNKILREVSHNFSDSIERPLRLAYMKASLGPEWHITLRLEYMCLLMVDDVGWNMSHDDADSKGLSALPGDQIFKIWSKAMKTKHPSEFIKVLDNIGWLEKFMPRIKFLQSIQQDAEWHPEGNVFNHSLIAMDKMAAICKRDGCHEDEIVVSVTAALLHDIGKITTTKFMDKAGNTPKDVDQPVKGEFRWRAWNHDIEGVDPTIEFLTHTVPFPNSWKKVVTEMVEKHMFFVHHKKSTPKVSRRLQKDIKFITTDDVFRIVEADYSARPPLPEGLPEDVRASKKWIADNPIIEWIVDGKMLLDAGMKPGKELGTMLDRCRLAQINGRIVDIKSAKKYIKDSGVKSKT